MKELKLSDFDSVENLLKKEFCEYSIIKQKLFELNNQFNGFSVFREYLLTPEYIKFLKGIENNDI
jgi:hypothetical protein